MSVSPLLQKHLIDLGLSVDVPPDAHGWKLLLERLGDSLGQLALRDPAQPTFNPAPMGGSDANFQMALRSANASTWEADLRTGLISFSDSWAALRGLPASASKTDMDELLALVPPEDTERAWKALSDTVKGVTSEFLLEYRLKTQSGDDKWILSHGQVSERNPADGRAIRMAGVNLDITERKLTELKLTESLARFRAREQLSTEIYWEMDAKLRFVAVLDTDDQTPQASLKNEGLRVGLRLWEIPGVEVMGPPADIERTKSAIAARLPFKNFLVRQTSAGGEINFLQIAGAPKFDGSGVFLGYRGIANNVTEFLQNQQRLADQTERLKIAQAAAKTLVFDWDIANNAFEFSDSPEWLLGPQPDANGKYPPIRQQVHPDDRAYFEATSAKSLRTGVGQQTEFRVVRTDGQVIWIKGTETIILGADGKPVRMIVAVSDISERKRYELALSEALVKAQAANDAKSRFLANMSHEIRTPMNAVIGLSYLARQRGGDALQQDYLQKIDRAANSLLRIIDDILDISKIEAGKLDLDQSDFDLVKVVREVADLVTDRAYNKGLSGTLELPDSLPWRLVGDPTRLGQILTNLCSNAVKFTAKGGVSLALRILDKSDRDVEVSISVTDTGIGIEAQNIDKLFAPFTQADNSITREYGGTGLGLSISRQLAEMMGGRLTVESALGQGSTFRFTNRFAIHQDSAPAPVANVLPTPTPATAPVLSPHNALIAPNEPPAPLPTTVKLPLFGLRILLVEDDAINQIVAQGMLEPTGARVTLAENGRQAVDMVEAGRFDLVLMDMQMPVMGGIEATRLLRAKPGLADLPIVAMTGSAMAGDRERLLTAGLSDYIAKPVSVARLNEVLGKWASKMAPKAAAPTQGPAAR